MSDGALMTVLLFVYFVPSLIAMMRGHHNAGAIFLLNLLLGLTAFGWVGELVWSCTSIRRDRS